MSRQLNITVLVDDVEIPPNDPEFRAKPEKPITEYHVIQTLRSLGHSVAILGAKDVGTIAGSLTEHKPDIVFNLTEHFGGNRQFDKNIVALLELLEVPFTGTGATGLMLARDKRLCKELLSLHKIRVPDFISLPPGIKWRISKNLHYPLVVKPAFEDGSEGISKLSLVYNETSLQERARFIHERWKQPVIAEEYIEGRELYASVMGNKRLVVLPIRECFFEHNGNSSPVLLTFRVKWNEEYRKKWNISFGFAELEPAVLNNINHVCKRVYRILQMRDYGRIDFRLTADNKIVILEANPNPDIAYGEEIAEAADKAGMSYERLIDRILHYALERCK
jgi:D-alanine-D-alanine ligase